MKWHTKVIIKQAATSPVFSHFWKIRFRHENEDEDDGYEEDGMEWEEEAKSKMHLRKNICRLNHSTANTLYLCSVWTWKSVAKCKHKHTVVHDAETSSAHNIWRDEKWEMNACPLFAYKRELIWLKCNTHICSWARATIAHALTHTPSQSVSQSVSKHRASLRQNSDGVFKCTSTVQRNALQTMCLHIEKQQNQWIASFLGVALFYFLSFISFGCFHINK